MHGDASVRTIIVAGDTTIDWLLARARKPTANFAAYQYVWGSDLGTKACSQAGGAALLTGILTAALDTAETGIRVEGAAVPAEALVDPANDQFTRSYSVWMPFPRAVGDKKTVWRAGEFWGSDTAAAVPARPATAGSGWGIVLDDVNLGFRDNADRWPEALKTSAGEPAWIVVKLGHPVASGALWEHLAARFADRLTLIVPVSELRKASLNIGYALSWEQTATEIVQAVTCHTELNKASRIVIPIGVTGAVVVERGAGSRLVFDPYRQEEDWLRDHPGISVGYTSCYVAAIVAHLAGASPAQQLSDAVCSGSQAARALHMAGYAAGDGKVLPTLRFPLEDVSAAIRNPASGYSVLPLTDTAAKWTILERRMLGDIHSLAAAVVRRGPEPVLTEVPLERIGNWSSVDRTEIESVRSLRNIMTEYVQQFRPSRPLSVAVFGPPGAGKSFAVKEAARALMPGKLSTLEFNLSQFESAEELAAAFHRVRDAALRQELPLVFWDEFDTPLQGRELGWLRYFLAPMQDGEFRESGQLHPLGPAVFVFAGGVFPALAAFRLAAEATPVSKGRDFVSRLRGFLNILGPNARDGDDRFFVLRRALLLRSLLKRKAPHIFGADGSLSMDEGLLRAFLQVSTYRHGARSMECVIDMSALTGKLLFERSCLPAPDQLDLHVDGTEFLRIMAPSARSAGA